MVKESLLIPNVPGDYARLHFHMRVLKFFKAVEDKKHHGRTQFCNEFWATDLLRLEEDTSIAITIIVTFFTIVCHSTKLVDWDKVISEDINSNSNTKMRSDKKWDGWNMHWYWLALYSWHHEQWMFPTVISQHKKSWQNEMVHQSPKPKFFLQ